MIPLRLSDIERMERSGQRPPGYVKAVVKQGRIADGKVWLSETDYAALREIFHKPAPGQSKPKKTPPAGYVAPLKRRVGGYRIAEATGRTHLVRPDGQPLSSECCEG